MTNLKSLIAKLSPASRRALEAAANVALSRTHHEVDIEHVLLELLSQGDGDLPPMLKTLGVAESRLRDELMGGLARLRSGNTRNPVLSERIPRWLEASWLIASVDFGATQLRGGFLLLGLLATPELWRSVESSCASLTRVTPDQLRELLPELLRRAPEARVATTATEKDISGSEGESAPTGALGAGVPTPSLDRFTVDLTTQARAGKIDPVLGREGEIRQMVDILLRRRQNNPILTGEPGVGKTAVVEGLALRIAAGEVPEPLQNVALRTLDLGLLQAGASVKGEFENRLRGVIDEVKASLVPIILFIDEAHTMIGAGGQAGQSDAANLLKPALARGELRTIAATTWAEYKKYFEKDAALARRFQVVKVEEPDEENAIQMLRGVVGTMETHHRVRILDEAVVEAVKLSARYIAGRQLPDKGVSVLDTACARVALSRASKPAVVEDLTRLVENVDREIAALGREQDEAAHGPRLKELAARKEELAKSLKEAQDAQAAQQALIDTIQETRQALAALPPEGAEAPKGKRKAGSQESQRAQLRATLQATQAQLHELHQQSPLVYDCVDGATVAEIVSAWTGIPLGRMLSDEIDNVRRLQDLLEQRVVGQNHALALIARRLRIARANLEDPGKPKGVFLLVGPSGVGKTETALALANELYGGERNLVCINMSEYQEAHSVSGLKGSPPGYVGYGEGGVLTEAVRRRPYSVVLLDEVEKAHPDVLELFFQVFDKGVLEDAEGREVDFRNTVILLTSNVGTQLIMQAVEHGVTVNGQSRAPTPEDLAELLRPDLQKAFKPAFLGRLNVVPYYPVQDDVMKRIIRLKLERVRARIEANHGARLDFGDALVELIASRCTEVDSGARNADAIIADTVLANLSDAVLERMAAGEPVRKISLKVKKDKLSVSVA
ncbi:type VI secretion system ATPase TssH [Azospira inquinata]|uniref:Type VI secretion system ATPase TssH n=1 Tax=Azospira inquinata TaxID=2785627 RepID=A0A975SNB0_9RHOO|nr:type VI secretion system ATPase TssH [Azospira inquinata]QWT45143.1 type VI secretion system ATPase TssH [Azospira inquinata]QWT49524.1 type VI secretion system ATPase TssH [Azospira inquinata]